MTSIGRKHRQATRLSFLVAGLAMATWAAIVPFAQIRTGTSEASFGLLLLSLGGGSIIAMPFTGALATRVGCRSVILGASALVCMTLPLLAVAPDALTLAITLFLFGAAMGSLEVALNIQAVMVEKTSDRTLLSEFHAMYNIGGIFGAGGMAALLTLGLAPAIACIALAVVLAGLMLTASAHLLPRTLNTPENTPTFVRPTGPIVGIAIFCFILFLAEGSVLDWSAILLIQQHRLDPSYGGLSYAAFSLTMTIMRLTGDRIIRYLGESRTVLLGGIVAAVGYIVAVAAPGAGLSILGFALVGAGKANIVPILLRAAGRQNAMPPGLAVTAVMTAGYGGILVGPAGIGLIAGITGLPVALAAVGILLLAVAILAPRTARCGAAIAPLRRV